MEVFKVLVKEKYKYKVFVSIPFGIDDTLYTPYSEIEHTNYKDAKAEYEKAKADERVIYACIKRIFKEESD